MAERYSTLPKTLECPPLPQSAWSLESLGLYNTKPTKQREPAQRNDLSLEQHIPQSSYQSQQSRTSTSTQPNSQDRFEKPQTGRDRKARHKHQQSSNQDTMQDNYSLPASTRDKTRGRESAGIRPRGHKSTSQRTQSKNRTSRTIHPNRSPRSRGKNSRRSHSKRRRSKRKHRNQQPAPSSYTILQWLLRKLSCGG